MTDPWASRSFCIGYRGGLPTRVHWDSSSNYNAPSQNQTPGLAFAATNLTNYYIPTPGSDYTIEKKFESPNAVQGTIEGETVTLNSIDRSSDSSNQMGRGSTQDSHVEEAFNYPVMCETEHLPKVTPKVQKREPKKLKRLTKLKFE